ncbi:MAG: AbrB/MazE/SpoVT family DNA-binding domain-containing protein [bacterium]|jgi:AbrB family looped-hinge helix DNA binding protein
MNMITKVTGKNQVTIPVSVAEQLAIHRGSRLDWRVLDDGQSVEVRVLPTRGELARKLWGRGSKQARPGSDAVAVLIAQRVRDDEERRRALGNS